MEDNAKLSTYGIMPPVLPAEMREALQDFFAENPNDKTTEHLLWRMFFHATLYDMQENGTAAYFEDYGQLKQGLVDLLQTLRVYYVED